MTKTFPVATGARKPFSRSPLSLSMAAAFGAVALGIAGCGGGGDDSAQVAQPTLQARSKPILTVEDKRFKDLNANGRLDAYEDWRLDVDQRVNDLVAQMTLEEKAGLMLIDTMNAGANGAPPATAAAFINDNKMRRFIFRSVVTATPTSGQVTPLQAAGFMNAIQELSEASRLGIPSLFKSNARNHYEKDARVGINEAAGAFTEFPKEAGIASAALGEEALRTGKTPTVGDMSIVRTFAQTMGDEWKSIGLRGMYGYMADMSTEPRWYRVHETFTEDADLNANIIKTLVETLQGPMVNGSSVSPESAVALTMKHFPGGGPQELGLDPHYTFGKTQVYPGGNFGYHLKPFVAAIDAGVSAIMPYYGVPIEVTYEGVKYDQLGMAFSKQIVTDLLRGKLGFKGYVNSDTGVINDRAWGLERKTVPERVAAAINGGTETLSGFNQVKTIVDLVNGNLLSVERVNEAAKRLLKEQFQLGLFENPYVDASRAPAVIGSEANRLKGQEIQRKSITLLQNQDKTLPLKPGARIYSMGMARTDIEKYGFSVVDGDAAVNGARPSAAGADYAVIRVEVSNPRAATALYRSTDAATGANPAYISPITGKVWGADDPTGLDNGVGFGGSFPWEASNLSFTTMAKSQSWQITPKLSDIQAVMNEVGAKKTVLSIYFRQPYVMDEASGIRNAGAIVAGFGVSNTALLDVLSGRFAPQGRMPFALANNLQAVIDNQPDVPGYPAKDTLFPFGFGLTY
jgi:beta-glucosidase